MLAVNVVLLVMVAFNGLLIPGSIGSNELRSGWNFANASFTSVTLYKCKDHIPALQQRVLVKELHVRPYPIVVPGKFEIKAYFEIVNPGIPSSLDAYTNVRIMLPAGLVMKAGCYHFDDKGCNGIGSCKYCDILGKCNPLPLPRFALKDRRRQRKQNQSILINRSRDQHEKQQQLEETSEQRFRNDFSWQNRRRLDQQQQCIPPPGKYTMFVEREMLAMPTRLASVAQLLGIRSIFLEIGLLIVDRQLQQELGCGVSYVNVDFAL